MNTQPASQVNRPRTNGNGIRKPEPIASVRLQLDVVDHDSVQEICARKEGRARSEYSLAALRVGLLSLKHARGQVDAEAVRREGDRILNEMNSTLDGYRSTLTDGVNGILKEYFDPNSGRFQERVERLIRKDGDLEQVLRRQIGADGSELAATLSAHVGESSPLMNVLDPAQSDGIVSSIKNSAEEVLKAESERILAEFSLDNKEGALTRMIAELSDNNGKLAGDLTERIEDAVSEFSLDKDDSALSRLMRKVETAQKTISSEFSLDNDRSALRRLKDELLGVLTEQNDRNTVFQRDVTVALEAMKARREESLRSTRHGDDFESAVVEFVTREANRAGDIPTATGRTTGLIRNNKTGDAVVEMGPESSAAGVKYVVEAKESASYDLAKSREEIEQARKNRGAAVGIFVWSKISAPANVESFSRIGDDIFVIWDAEDLGSDVILSAALSMAKAMCVRESSKRTAEAAEFEAIDRAILAIEKEANRLEKMRTMTETIKRSSEKVLDEIRKMSDGLQSQVGNLRDAVDGLNSI